MSDSKEDKINSLLEEVEEVVEEIAMVDYAAEIKDLLAKYADFQHAVTVNELQWQAEKVKVIPDDVQIKLQEIEVEFGGKTELAREKLAAIKANIAAKMFLVPKEQYKTIKGSGYMVVAKGGKPVEVIDADVLVKGLTTLAVNYPAIAPEIANILQMAKTSETTARSSAVQVDKK